MTATEPNVVEVGGGGRNPLKKERHCFAAFRASPGGGAATPSSVSVKGNPVELGKEGDGEAVRGPHVAAPTDKNSRRRRNGRSASSDSLPSIQHHDHLFLVWQWKSPSFT